MANDEYRDQHEAAREVGLAARHETRVERAREREIVQTELTRLANEVRKQVADEIYQALKRRRNEAREDQQRGWPLLSEAMIIASEIGAREHSNQATEETK